MRSPLITECFQCAIQKMGFEVSWTACTGAEALRKITEEPHPDIIILDFLIQNPSIHNLSYQIEDETLKGKVIVINDFDSEFRSLLLYRNKFFNLVSQSSTTEELHHAILAVKQGGKFISQTDAERLLLLFRSTEEEFHAHWLALSERELAFLRYSTTDLTYHQIAEEMGIRPRVIDNIRDSLFEKLKIRNRASLAVFAIRHGLV